MAVSAAVALTLGGCGVMDIPSSSGTVTVWVDAPSTGGSSAPKPVPTVTSTQQAAPTSMVAGRAKGAVTSFSEAMHRIDGTRRSKDYSSFVSPSGNIFCIIGSGGAACEVRDGRIPSPVDGLCPAGGPTDVGRIELRPDGASPVCNNDTIRTGNAPKLSYRTRTHVSGTDVTCLSEEAGVTCVDSQNQHGFFLARGGFSTF